MEGRVPVIKKSGLEEGITGEDLCAAVGLFYFELINVCWKGMEKGNWRTVLAS